VTGSWEPTDRVTMTGEHYDLLLARITYWRYEALRVRMPEGGYHAWAETLIEGEPK
jgi:hypothetical protein